MIIYLLSCKCEPLKIVQASGSSQTRGAVSHRHHLCFPAKRGVGLAHPVGRLGAGGVKGAIARGWEAIEARGWQARGTRGARAHRRLPQADCCRLYGWGVIAQETNNSR